MPDSKPESLLDCNGEIVRHFGSLEWLKRFKPLVRRSVTYSRSRRETLPLRQSREWRPPQ